MPEQLQTLTAAASGAFENLNPLQPEREFRAKE